MNKKETINKINNLTIDFKELSDEYKKDPDIAYAAIMIDQENMSHIDSSLYKNVSFANKLIDVDMSYSYYFARVDDLIFIKSLIKKNPYLYCSIKHSFQMNKEIIYDAVSEMSEMVKKVPEEAFEDRDIAIFAIKNNLSCFYNLPKKHLDDTDLLIELQYHIFAFNEFYNHNSNTEDFYEAIVNLQEKMTREKRLNYRLEHGESNKEINHQKAKI